MMVEERPMFDLTKKPGKPGILLIVFMALAVCIGGAVTTVKAYGTTDTNGGRTYGTIQVEYRFKEGETPNIPETIEQYGFTYRLVSQSPPMLESTLPNVRTYTYRVQGLLTQEQIDEAGLQNITLTPVSVVMERKVDVEVVFKNMPTNDVDDIPSTYPCKVTSGTDPSGFETRTLERAGVTFDIAGYETGPSGSPTPPAGYNATVVYRGVETYSEIGYYEANAVFRTTEDEGDTKYYVIVADYETEAFDPPVDEFIVEPAVPEVSGPVVIVDEDEPRLGQNILDVISGNVPFGSLDFVGAWSLISAILSFAGILIAAGYAIGTFIRRRYVSALAKMNVYDEKWFAMVKQRGLILRILTVVLGIITLISWLFLDDFSKGFVWINSNTPVILILFAITIVLCIFTNIRERKIYLVETEESDTVENVSA